MLDSNFVNLSASGKREEGQLITPLIIKMLSVCQGKNSSTLFKYLNLFIQCFGCKINIFTEEIN